MGFWGAQNSENPLPARGSLVLRSRALHGTCKPPCPCRGRSCSAPAKSWPCPERDMMQASVSQPKPVCPGFACGSAGEELAPPERLWVKSLLWTLRVSLFSYDQQGGSCSVAQILQTWHVVSSTAALCTRSGKDRTFLARASRALAISTVTPGPPLHRRKFKLAAFPVVTSLLPWKGL